jgi:hypothetical protein
MPNLFHCLGPTVHKESSSDRQSKISQSRHIVTLHSEGGGGGGYPKESCTFVPSLRSCTISGVTLGSLQPHTFDGLRHVVVTIYRTYTIPALKVFGRRTFHAEFRRGRSNVSKVQMGVGVGG